MAMKAYFELDGIAGDCTETDREDLIILYGVDHKVFIPQDTGESRQSSQREHTPLTITKAVDPASPLLYQNMCLSTKIASGTIKFIRTIEDATAPPNWEIYYTVEMTDIRIVSMHAYTPNVFVPENKVYRDMEEVGMMYGSITWTFTDGNVSYVDTWTD